MLPPSTDLASQLRELQAELAALQAENAWLKRQLFGPGKSEKIDRLQTQLALPETPTPPAAPKTETITYQRVAAPKEKRTLPAELFKNVPVKETIVIEPEEVRAQPEAFERIGEERTFEIDVVPPQVFKREFVRPKYRHKLDRQRPPVVAAAP